jgi:hypothetical protein
MVFVLRVPIIETSKFDVEMEVAQGNEGVILVGGNEIV